MPGTETRYTTLMDKLKQHGHRITPQRAAILKIFIESQEHPSVEQVYEQIKADFPMTSLATIYKTVTLLKEEKEILELGFANESSRYDGHKPYPHPHLMCIRCQRIIDPEIELFNELPQELAQKYGYQIVNQRVDFFGICPECQKNERKP
jgi:Fur family transcriptional regulator, peroxide stress response regulator